MEVVASNFFNTELAEKMLKLFGMPFFEGLTESTPHKTTETAKPWVDMSFVGRGLD
jgi:hypothetical protein